MFAHHVIKDLEDEQNPVTNKFQMETKRKLANFIKESTKYHMKNLIENVYDILHPMITKHEKETGDKFKIFKSQIEGITSPFAVVWFEWFAKESPYLPKYASLILKSESPSNKRGYLLSIFTFPFNQPKNRWGLSPIASSVDMVTQEITTNWLIPEEIYERLQKKDIQGFREINQYSLSCTHLCLLFLNCRNVETIITNPPPKLQKKRKKKGRLPLFSYHTLEIKDMRKKVVKPDGYVPTKTGTKLRYHQMPARIVRYSAEKPLFGNPKNVGLYAFKSYYRGDPEKGVTIRDYERR